MIQHLAERDVQQRAVGIERERAFQTGLRALDVAGLLFGQRQLQQRGDVGRIVVQQRIGIQRPPPRAARAARTCDRAPTARRDPRDAARSRSRNSGIRVS